MKTRTYFLSALSLVIFLAAINNIRAGGLNNAWELGIKAMNSSGQAIQVSVTAYSFDTITRDLKVAGSGTTIVGSFPNNDCNGWADINDNNSAGAMFQLLPAENLYYIQVENKFIIITFHGGTQYGDIKLIYNSNYDSLSVASNSSNYSIDGPYTWTNYSITLKNDFGNDRLSCYGNIHFNSETLPNIGYSSGVTLTREHKTFPHTVSGEDNQLVNNFSRKWRNWTEDGYVGISEVISSPQTITRTAKYAKQVNATISLNPNGSTITMNGNVITGSQYMYEDLSYIFDAENQVSSTWISFVFDHWIYDGATVTNNTIAINYPTGNHSLAAYFVGTARPDPMNIHFTSKDGEYITIAWTDHPDSHVTQYQVWRYKEGGSPSAIATLNHGTTSFTDGAYIQNASGATKLFYTVKAHYYNPPSDTWNDPGYLLNRGDGGIQPSIVNNNNSQQNTLAKELSEKYSVDNYPNPFNPTTKINYQLPEDGMVTLKVYDVLGKEVATLVNDHRTAGYYSVGFNASNLPSGIYIYKITASNYTLSKKMLLMK